MGNAGSLCGFFFFFLGERFSIAVIVVQWLWSYTLGNQVPAPAYCWMTLSKLCNLLQKPHLKYDESDIYLVKLFRAMPPLDLGNRGLSPGLLSLEGLTLALL